MIFWLQKWRERYEVRLIVKRNEVGSSNKILVLIFDRRFFVLFPKMKNVCRSVHAANPFRLVLITLMRKTGSWLF